MDSNEFNPRVGYYTEPWNGDYLSDDSQNPRTPDAPTQDQIDAWYASSLAETENLVPGTPLSVDEAVERRCEAIRQAKSAEYHASNLATWFGSNHSSQNSVFRDVWLLVLAYLVVIEPDMNLTEVFHHWPIGAGPGAIWNRQRHWDYCGQSCPCCRSNAGDAGGACPVCDNMIECTDLAATCLAARNHIRGPDGETRALTRAPNRWWRLTFDPPLNSVVPTREHLRDAQVTAPPGLSSGSPRDRRPGLPGGSEHLLCYVCSIQDTEHTCPVCHKRVCDRCWVAWPGETRCISCDLRLAGLRGSASRGSPSDSAKPCETAEFCDSDGDQRVGVLLSDLYESWYPKSSGKARSSKKKRNKQAKNRIGTGEAGPSGSAEAIPLPNFVPVPPPPAKAMPVPQDTTASPETPSGPRPAPERPSGRWGGKGRGEVPGRLGGQSG